MIFDRFFMMSVIIIISLGLATSNLRAELHSEDFYSGLSVNYNVNDKDNDFRETFGAKISAGYLFTTSYGLEASYGYYGRNIQGVNVNAYQLKGLYLYDLGSGFTLYTGIGLYSYDSKTNPSGTIGVKKQLDKKLSTHFGYEYLYKGYGDDDIYSVSVGMSFYF